MRQGILGQEQEYSYQTHFCLNFRVKKKQASPGKKLMYVKCTATTHFMVLAKETWSSPTDHAMTKFLY